MPERYLHLDCYGCGDLFKANGLLKWTRNGNRIKVDLFSDLVVFYVAHHKGEGVGSGHNQGVLTDGDGGPEIGVLDVGTLPSEMVPPAYWASLKLNDFGNGLK
jgi:hypothetical protein